ncbi:MAG TPA: cytochrome b N-terminal domain-containing protein [Chthoniobacter sp.]|jgi:ubiquinol-cytochrome c reductase cytochrome b subunit
MIRWFGDWLDRRIDHRRLLHEALYEAVPGGARWRYVWGSTLTFAIIVQFITGLALWFGYSPSAQTAWESIYYLETATPGGWWLRGIHHWTAQLMVPLLAFHLLQVVIDGAYRAPREVNFWFGLGLLGLTLALSLTGYLLPWDQKGYWASKVATNLLANVPFVGPSLQKLVIGGSDFGHFTLTRFFALHAGLLPALLVALIVGHVWLFRRHGLTARQPLRKPNTTFWPDQVLVDAVACLAVMAIVLVLDWWQHGAELTSPANPSESYSAARPDWYFMGLFQLLKFQDHFEQLPGGGMLWCTVIIPGAVAGFLFLMPLWSGSRFGHGLNLFALSCGLLVFAALTAIAFWHDAHDEHYRDAVAQGHREADRVKELATRNGVPPEGALALLTTDPFTQAPKLFAAKCASCHSYDGRDGLGAALGDRQSAAELKGWGSREWLRNFLDPEKIGGDHIWGGTALVHPPADKKRNPMVDYVLDDIPKYTPEEKAMLERVILAVSAEAQLPVQREADARDAVLIEQGRKEFGDSGLNCADCHEFRGEGGGKGCLLTGWGSREWTAGIVHNPADKNYYGKRNDRMQAFGQKHELSARQIDMLAQWLRGEVN